MISTAVFLDGYTLLFKKLKTTKKKCSTTNPDIKLFKRNFLL